MPELPTIIMAGCALIALHAAIKLAIALLILIWPFALAALAVAVLMLCAMLIAHA